MQPGCTLQSLSLVATRSLSKGLCTQGAHFDCSLGRVEFPANHLLVGLLRRRFEGSRGQLSIFAFCSLQNSWVPVQKGGTLLCLCLLCADQSLHEPWAPFLYASNVKDQPNDDVGVPGLLRPSLLPSDQALHELRALLLTYRRRRSSQSDHPLRVNDIKSHSAAVFSLLLASPMAVFDWRVRKAEEAADVLRALLLVGD